MASFYAQILFASTLLALVTSASITRYTYSGDLCEGAPKTTSTYPEDKCSLGLEYKCQTGQQCLRIRTIDLNGTSTTDQDAPTSSSGKLRRRQQQHNNNDQTLVVGSSSDSSACGGKVLTTNAFVCDLCTGGASGVSTTAKDCNTDHPYIAECLGNGQCQGSCTAAGGKRTKGCYINGTVGLDVDVVPCSAVLYVDYSDYQTCTGSVEVQTVFPAGICDGFQKYEC